MLPPPFPLRAWCSGVWYCSRPGNINHGLNIADSFRRVNPNNENPSRVRERFSEARFVSGCLFYALRRRRTAVTASSRASTPAPAISRILGTGIRKRSTSMWTLFWLRAASPAPFRTGPPAGTRSTSPPASARYRFFLACAPLYIVFFC